MFYWLNWIEDSLWAYLCFPAILIVGGILTWESRLFQIRKFPHVVARFYHLLFLREPSDRRGVHPLKAFFFFFCGCVGIGNIVGICTGIQIGGPGALFWVWCTALLGVVVKYAEVYLGIKYRELSADGGYNGGPMYFLQRVSGSLFFPKVVCLLLCIYGVEIYQFSIIAHNVSINFHWNPYLVIGVLLAMVIFAGSGGVRRVGNISSAIIPFFVLLFLGMGIWVLILHAHAIPEAIADVFRSAFTGHAAIGGFVGSGIMMTVSQGIRRACYSGDIGIGYASVIHSETAQEAPEKQASLVLFDIFLDTFVICTMSLIL
ncbi:MAG: sodium:alanine symporter family protein, partial [Chlamydiia bacterium]|nr:sodium:alanine symporter family protein [Chlamydiia bacterium]